METLLNTLSHFTDYNVIWLKKKKKHKCISTALVMETWEALHTVEMGDKLIMQQHTTHRPKEVSLFEERTQSLQYLYT